MQENPIQHTSKLQTTGMSIFTIMPELARKYKALNLSQFVPDYNCDKELIELVYKYMRDGYNQYSPMPGILELREAIAARVNSRYGVIYNAESEVNITAGATQAIYTAISTFIREGDEVIVFEPAYDCFVPAIKLNGGIPVFVELEHPDYKIDVNSLMKVVSRNTKMIILNNPHNPSGKVFTKEDFQSIEKVTKDSDILVLCDEVFENIVFDGEYRSACQFPELAARSIIISSFAKSFATPAWKLGYCIAPEYLMKEFRKTHQYVVFTTNTPMQHAFAEYMSREKIYEGISEFYKKKRDLFLEAIKESRFKYTPSQGTFFQLLNYESISEEPELDFAKRLTKEFKIASIPVSEFYHKRAVDKKLLRFCFAKRDDTLLKAAEILCKI